MARRESPIQRQHYFASDVLAELHKRDARAKALVQAELPRLPYPVIGLMDQGEFVPLLALGAPSQACNVMSLFVYQQGKWQPTFQRGTPQTLANLLSGPFAYLWTLAVTARGGPSQSHDPTVQ